MTSKRVAMFTGKALDFISAPLINSAEYLASLGYLVDIFARESRWLPVPTFDSFNISYIPYRIIDASFPGKTFLGTPHQLDRMMGDGPYEFFVGFDLPGLINAAMLGKWRRTPYIYHSLEIDCEAALLGWQRKFDKRIERWLNRGAALTITQDEYRADLLAFENHIDRERISVVYNSPFGELLPEKSDWLRQRFDIPSTKQIVLVVGSLIKEHMVDLIAATVESWPTQFVLVMHGWFSDKSIEEEVRRIAARNNERMFISTTLLPYSERNLVFQSANIGLIFYNPITDNHRYVGAAAGKLFDFMRCGVPVIAIDLPGMKELVEDSGAGAVVQDVTQIPATLDHILQDYGQYRDRSLATFDRYSFAQSYARALARIS